MATNPEFSFEVEVASGPAIADVGVVSVSTSAQGPPGTPGIIGPQGPSGSDAGVTTTLTNGRVEISVLSHFAITNGHGVYYPSTSDTPTSGAAYFDVASRSLILLGAP